MKIEQWLWHGAGAWSPPEKPVADFAPQLVLLFGDRAQLEAGSACQQLRERFPHASFAGCSTAGEIRGTAFHEGSIVATAVQLEHTRVELHQRIFGHRENVRATACELGRALASNDLRHVFVLSDGVDVNGSELAAGLQEVMPPGVQISGGLSADGTDFRRTVVLGGTGTVDRALVGIGFYGAALRVSFGCRGGWEPFGPRRLVTRSSSNILLQLDGEPALEVYERYLGELARELPASGLHFPLAIRIPGQADWTVRTILGIDRDRAALVYAGDIPQGVEARLMRARLDGLVDGAIGAGAGCRTAMDRAPELAILVSCVGRRLVLRQRVEEELEGVRASLGTSTALAGFYSYGELSPFEGQSGCTLHNQTMSITGLAEAA